MGAKVHYWAYSIVPVLLVAVCVSGLGNWAIETVSDNGPYNTSITCNISHWSYIAYRQQNNLNCAYKTETGWQYPIIDTNVGGISKDDNVDLELDDAGHPHIAYWTYYEGLRYAWFDGSDYHTETVDSGGGAPVSLALDGSNHPHIAYYDDNEHDLKYAWHDGTSWHIETVDPGWAAGWWCVSLALDSADRPHISYAANNGAWYYASWDGDGWHIHEFADIPGEVRFSSLALDNADRPHIALYEYGYTYGVLKYASWNGSDWQIETVDLVEEGYVGAYPCIALGATGRPRISYYDGSNKDLKYAYWNGLDWQIEIVDSEWDAGRCSHLVLDSLNQPHISYISCDNSLPKEYYLKHAYLPTSNLSPVAEAGPNQLVVDWDHSGSETVQLDGTLSYDADGMIVSYSWKVGGGEVSTQVSPALVLNVGTTSITLAVTDNDGSTAIDTVVVTAVAESSWNIETVDADGVAGSDNSIALDEAGHAHISYCDYNNNNSNLKYAYWNGTAWQIETVDSEGSVGEASSIALDDSGRPHISYYDETNENLKYAYWNGLDWQVEKVDVDGSMEGYTSTSIALDGSGHPHIAYTVYRDSTHRDLKCAYWNGSDWQIETVDSGNVECQFVSIAVDAIGKPHISYYDRYYGELRYAYYEDSNWQLVRVHVVGQVGENTSIALDANGHPHISYLEYYDYLDCSLKYAYWNGTVWQIDTVVSRGKAANGSAIALDEAGHPHISYYDPSNDTLKHAWYDGTTWSVETIDAMASTGASDISVLGTGTTWISYYAATWDLKTAHQTVAEPPPPSTPAVFRVDSTGNVLGDNAFYGAAFNSGSADIAEWVPVSEPVEPGDVLELDPENPGHYRKSRGPCSDLVAGVVSTQPGFVLGSDTSSSLALDLGPWTDDSRPMTPDRALLALLGVVPVKVTDEGGPIQPGDLLVCSSIPGYAMKWSAENGGDCGLIGKAMEPLDSGTGVIQVLLMR